MALFSRRPKRKPDARPADAPTSETDAPAPEPVDAPAPEPVDAGQDEGAQAAASVGISVSSYRGLGATAPVAAESSDPEPTPALDGATPRRTETIRGLRDNVLLRESLARLPEKPSPEQVLEVARQLLQGHLFLRVKGDARALIAEGKGLPLAVATAGDRQFAIAFSSGAGLADSIRADGEVDTSAMGQPTMVVLRHVLAGTTAGLIIDPASAPARVVLPRPLIERMLGSVDEKLAIKTLLAAERTDSTTAAVADAMTRAPLWVAVRTPEDGGPVGIAEGRSPDGSRYLEVFSHPLEVAAMGRGDRSAPLTGEQLASALVADQGLAGVIIDPRGPWLRVTRDELAPVLALAS